MMRQKEQTNYALNMLRKRLIESQAHGPPKAK